MIDLRLPLGLLFTVLGLVMTCFGILSSHESIYDRSLGANVNLIWGLVEIVFGVIMLVFVHRPREKKY